MPFHPSIHAGRVSTYLQLDGGRREYTHHSDDADDGRAYIYDEASGETQWAAPDELSALAEVAEEGR